MGGGAGVDAGDWLGVSVGFSVVDSVTELVESFCAPAPLFVSLPALTLSVGLS